MADIDVIIAMIVIGCGATVFMDGYAWLQNRFFGISSLNYALVGRWIAGLYDGQFTHNNIMQSPSRPFERAIGWSFHYAIGVFYVGCMLASMGVNWLDVPNFWNPMVISLGGILAPFLIMQPAFGFGVAASKTSSPQVARQRTLTAHFTFGLGIYVAGKLWLQMAL